MAADTRAKGNPVIVHDPTFSGNWPKDALKFADAEQFLAHAETAQTGVVFVDEAKKLFDFDSARAEALVYAGRHRGLLLVLIAQRTKMVPPNARNMCSRVFSFRQQRSDAIILSDEYNDIFEQTPTLKPCHFVYSDGFNARAGSLDFSGGKPPVVKWCGAQTTPSEND